MVHSGAHGVVQNEAPVHAVAQSEVHEVLRNEDPDACEVVAQGHGALSVYHAAHEVEVEEEEDRDLSPDGGL